MAESHFDMTLENIRTLVDLTYPPHKRQHASAHLWNVQEYAAKALRVTSAILSLPVEDRQRVELSKTVMAFCLSIIQEMTTMMLMLDQDPRVITEDALSRLVKALLAVDQAQRENVTQH